MNLSTQFITYFNIALIIIFALTIYSGYKKGFITTIATLFSTIVVMIIMWPISNIFSKITLIKLANISSIEILNSISQQFFNRIVWYILLVVITSIILMLIINISKILNKIIIIGTINKLLGIFAGYLNTVLYAMLLGIFLTSPLVNNGETVIQKTILNLYTTPIKIVEKQFDQSLQSSIVLTVKEYITNHKLSEEEWNNLVNTLLKFNISSSQIKSLQEGR